jgi:cyclohexanone monooxygenase
MKPALEASGRARTAIRGSLARGGLPFLGFGDLLFEKAANDTIADFARRKIRGIVIRPRLSCCPENVLGCKRPASIPIIW